jgi:hypothetical protein
MKEIGSRISTHLHDLMRDRGKVRRHGVSIRPNGLVIDNAVDGCQPFHDGNETGPANFSARSNVNEIRKDISLCESSPARSPPRDSKVCHYSHLSSAYLEPVVQRQPVFVIHARSTLSALLWCDRSVAIMLISHQMLENMVRKAKGIMKAVDFSLLVAKFWHS